MASKTNKFIIVVDNQKEYFTPEYILSLLINKVADETKYISESWLERSISDLMLDIEAKLKSDTDKQAFDNLFSIISAAKPIMLACCYILYYSSNIVDKLNELITIKNNKSSLIFYNYLIKNIIAYCSSDIPHIQNVVNISTINFNLDHNTLLSEKIVELDEDDKQKNISNAICGTNDIIAPSLFHIYFPYYQFDESADPAYENNTDFVTGDRSSNDDASIDLPLPVVFIKDKSATQDYVILDFSKLKESMINILAANNQLEYANINITNITFPFKMSFNVSLSSLYSSNIVYTADTDYYPKTSKFFSLILDNTEFINHPEFLNDLNKASIGDTAASANKNIFFYDNQANITKEAPLLIKYKIENNIYNMGTFTSIFYPGVYFALTRTISFNNSYNDEYNNWNFPVPFSSVKSNYTFNASDYSKSALCFYDIKVDNISFNRISTNNSLESDDTDYNSEYEKNDGLYYLLTRLKETYFNGHNNQPNARDFLCIENQKSETSFFLSNYITVTISGNFKFNPSVVTAQLENNNIKYIFK